MKNIKRFENFNSSEEFYSDNTEETHSGDYELENNREELENDEYPQETDSIDFKIFKEHHTTQNYMFFANLETMKRYIDAIMELPQEEVDEILSEHDWASDHVSVACENLEHVHNFLLNHNSPSSEFEDEDEFETDVNYESDEFDSLEDDEEIVDEENQ